jgi:hypothetical protein
MIQQLNFQIFEIITLRPMVWVCIESNISSMELATQGEAAQTRCNDTS